MGELKEVNRNLVTKETYTVDIITHALYYISILYN
jgi:hypothetical protein